MFVVLAALLLQAPATPAPSDTTSTLQHREGLYVGVGVGPAHVRFDCDGCGDAGGSTGGMVQLRVGVAASSRLTVGLELDGWGAEGKDASAWNTMVVTQFYPSRNSGFFLRGGAGLVSFHGRQIVDGPGETGNGTALVVGTGVDARFDRKLSLTPTLTFLYNDVGTTRMSGFTEREGVSAWVVALGVGMTWH